MTVTFDEALALIASRCQPAGPVETVPLQDADSRILAEDIVAPIAVPPADNSAVDGYAFRHADLPATGPGSFAVVGISAAGRPFSGQVGPGQAVRIFTGAVPPAACDTIAMQEDVSRDGDRLAIPAGLVANANLRRAGEDVQAGATILMAGTPLSPVEIGLLAAVGLAAVPVRRRLRVAVFSSGDELTQPGEALRPGAVYDANRPMLLALLARLGMRASDLGVLPDGQPAIRAALADAAAGHDAVLTSAGVSVGDEDHVRAAVLSLGALDFQGVAIKPGRPMTAGHVSGVPFFGLPGNPVAMMVNFLLLVRPGLLSLAGAKVEPPRRIPVVAAFSAIGGPGRREFLRVKLGSSEGKSIAMPCGRGGSAILSSLAACDGLVELDETTSEIIPGATVSFIPLAELGL